MKIYLRLASFAQAYRGKILLAFLCIVVTSLSQLVLAPAAGKVAEVFAQKNLLALSWFLLGVVGLFLLKGLFQYGQSLLLGDVNLRIITDIRERLYSHLQGLSLDFYNRVQVGDLISRLSNDLNLIQTAITVILTELFPNILLILGVIFYIFYLNWRLALLTLVVIPFLGWIISKFGDELQKASFVVQSKIADVFSIIQETLVNIRLIKAFAREEYEIHRFANENEKNYLANLRSVQVNALQQPVVGLFQVIGLAFALWFGGWEVVHGRLQPQDIISFAVAITLAVEPVLVFTKAFGVSKQAIVAIERIYQILDARPSVQEREDALIPAALEGEVEFRNVSFSFNGRDEVLQEMNLRVSPGEVIALVGPSGGGKTTFINLLMRFYDPSQGEILIDGMDIRSLNLSFLRQQMGVVPQESALFNGTIRENIRYGKLDATDEEIKEAAQVANALEFISRLPLGFETIIGERGVLLSGGQKQRLAIARAVLRKPRIMIFDEATSALDTESESLVQEALERVMKGRTTFIIAHRLSTIKKAHRILLLKNGKIIEEGTHEELVAKRGEYSGLYRLQVK